MAESSGKSGPTAERSTAHSSRGAGGPSGESRCAADARQAVCSPRPLLSTHVPRGSTTRDGVNRNLESGLRLGTPVAVGTPGPYFFLPKPRAGRVPRMSHFSGGSHSSGSRHSRRRKGIWGCCADGPQQGRHPATLSPGEILTILYTKLQGAWVTCPHTHTASRFRKWTETQLPAPNAPENHDHPRRRSFPCHRRAPAQALSRERQPPETTRARVGAGTRTLASQPALRRNPYVGTNFKDSNPVCTFHPQESGNCNF